MKWIPELFRLVQHISLETLPGISWVGSIGRILVVASIPNGDRCRFGKNLREKVLEYANAINDSGHIVGRGKHWGSRRAFLLIPQPVSE